MRDKIKGQKYNEKQKTKQNKTKQNQKHNKTKQSKKQIKATTGKVKMESISTPLQIVGELVSFEMVRRSCFTSSNRLITLVPVKSHEKGREDGIVTSTNGSHPWLALTQIFHNGSPSQDGYLKIS